MLSPLPRGVRQAVLASAVQRMPVPQAAPGQMPPQSPALYDFIPLYKVDCKIGNVGYDLSIDAVTGNVIKCEIDD